MRFPLANVRWILLAVAVLVAIPSAYWFGYQAGLRDTGPDHRAVVQVRRDATGNVIGASDEWFDLKKPEDVARLRAEEVRLKAAKVEYYVAKARVETSISAEPDPFRASSHR